MSSRTVILSVLLIAAVGCTRWGPHEVIESESLVEQTPRGAPYVQESKVAKARVTGNSTSDTDIHGRERQDATGGGTFRSVKETRCLQKFDVVRLQQLRFDYKPDALWADFLGGSLLGLAGLGTLISGLPRERPFSRYSNEVSPIPIVVGGVLMAGGAALIVHGARKSRAKNRPPSETGERTVTTVAIEDATGCPGFGAPPGEAPKNESAAKRLLELKELRDSGVLTEEEYEAKRLELVDQL